MTDRPITFCARDVLALLDGRKAQHRLAISTSNTHFNGRKWPDNLFARCHWDSAWVDKGPSPAGNPGPYLKVEWPYECDELLVARVYPMWRRGDRLWVREAWCDTLHGPAYRASWGIEQAWKSPATMPRWASRFTLTVTKVRVQRLQNISDDDAMAEGDTDRSSFARRWNSIHGLGSWDANPWVCALTFTVEKEGEE